MGVTVWRHRGCGGDRGGRGGPRKVETVAAEWRSCGGVAGVAVPVAAVAAPPRSAAAAVAAPGARRRMAAFRGEAMAVGVGAVAGVGAESLRS
jgi:hypothetical protein